MNGFTRIVLAALSLAAIASVSPAQHANNPAAPGENCGSGCPPVVRTNTGLAGIQQGGKSFGDGGPSEMGFIGGAAARG